jgi:hypothetical protein
VICGKVGAAAPAENKKTYLLKGTLPTALLERGFGTRAGASDVLSYNLTTTFLLDAEDGTDKVLRRQERGGTTTYLLITGFKDENGKAVYLENRLRRAMYQSLLRLKDPNMPVIKRKRYTFVAENHYLHEVDVHSDGLVRLIVNLPQATKQKYLLPEVLRSMAFEDVSNNPMYTTLQGLAMLQPLEASSGDSGSGGSESGEGEGGRKNKGEGGCVIS